MNLLVAENSNYTIDPFINKLSEVPNSSRLNISSNNYFECLKILKQTPVLTSKWLCIVDPKLSVNQMKTLLSKDNLNIITVDSKSKFKDLKQSLLEEGIVFRTFNNLEPPKDKIIEYVQKTLRVDYNISKYLCERHKFYLPKIMESIAILESIDTINKSTIKMYTERFNSIYLSSITDKILGLERVNNKKIIESIYKFRYGFSYLLKSIKGDLEIYEYVFNEISFGSLTLENYEEFIGELKSYNSLPNYRKVKIIEAYERLSYDKLYYIKLKVEEIDSNPSNIYKLIRLLGGS